MKTRRNVNSLPKIRAIIRDDKPINKEGKHPIDFIISLNGNRKRKSTGLYIKKRYWNKKKQRAHSKFLEHNAINKIIDTKISDFELYFVKMLALGQYINMSIVEEYFKDKRFDDFLGYFDAFIEYWNPKLESSTMRKYTDCRKVFTNFMKTKGFKKVHFIDIDKKIVKEFDEYLIYNRRVTSGTANNYHKPLKKLFNQAVEEEIIAKTPYIGFKPIDTGLPIKKDILTPKEVLAIKELKFKEWEKHLERYRNVFIFLLNTGMRFSDVKKAKIADIVGYNSNDENRIRNNSINKMPFINVVQQKTKILSKYILNKDARYSIMRTRYLFDIKEDELFGKITLQPFNRYLKIIAKMAGIEKNISSHVGRHSFSTILHNSKGASIENIADLLGHKNSKVTSTYIRKDNQNIAQLVEDLYAFEKIG